MVEIVSLQALIEGDGAMIPVLGVTFSVLDLRGHARVQRAYYGAEPRFRGEALPACDPYLGSRQADPMHGFADVREWRNRF